ncbi:hypothetical protein AB205_0149270 [Aquarana catesbeiana]|uniref:Ig-like domain-containing protein n=1 Tax=Aquarana catesbeiana TaxID=8400 RepID=A0A2G9R628_AQUCT|nr:hypothetical protein AB205_0149270 [Aquarana catesbeiana]
MTYDVQNALQNMKVGSHNLDIIMVRSNHTPAISEHRYFTNTLFIQDVFGTPNLQSMMGFLCRLCSHQNLYLNIITPVTNHLHTSTVSPVQPATSVPDHLHTSTVSPVQPATSVPDHLHTSTVSPVTPATSVPDHLHTSTVSPVQPATSVPDHLHTSTVSPVQPATSVPDHLHTSTVSPVQPATSVPVSPVQPATSVPDYCHTNTLYNHHASTFLLVQPATFVPWSPVHPATSVPDYCHTIIPRLRIYTEHPVVLGEPNILICSVTNIFPPVMSMTWLKNREKIDREFTENLFLPCQEDHSFFKFLYLAFIPSKNDIYTCEVKH